MLSWHPAAARPAGAGSRSAPGWLDAGGLPDPAPVPAGRRFEGLWRCTQMAKTHSFAVNWAYRLRQALGDLFTRPYRAR